MKAKASIRLAVRADAEILSDLAMETYVIAFGHTFGASDLAVHLEGNLSARRFVQYIKEDIILLAEVEGKIVGYTQFGRVKDVPDSTQAEDQELRRLYVDAEFQNRGIGTMLMRAALSSPQLANASNIYLDVWEHNIAAQRFYRRFGFKVVGSKAFEVGSRAETDLDLLMVRRSATPGNSGKIANV